MGFPVALDFETGATTEASFGLADGETSELGRASQRSTGQKEREAVRGSVHRGRPFRDPSWVESTAR